MNWFKCVLFFLTACFLISCSNMGIIKNEPNLQSELNGKLGFHFFLFVKSGDDNYRANGDGFIVKDKEFKFRIRDNLLDQHLFDYIVWNNGENEVILPADKTIYRSTNSIVSYLFAGVFLNLFFKNCETNIVTNKNTDIFLENNKIKLIMFSIDDNLIKLEILKRMTDTDSSGWNIPVRIKLEKGDDSIIFDIVSFSYKDFILITNDYTLYDVPDESILDWAGVLHGKR